MADWRKQTKVKKKKGVKRSLKGGALAFDRRKKKTIASLIKLEKDPQVENDPLQDCVDWKYNTNYLVFIWLGSSYIFIDSQGRT